MNYYNLCFVTLYPKMLEVAKAHGYALAVHGSMARDFDVVAFPWTNEACDARTLAFAIGEVVKGTFYPGEDTEHFNAGMPGFKPHGRLVWSFYLCQPGYCTVEGDTSEAGKRMRKTAHYIDLSVMPRLKDWEPAQPTTEKDNNENG